MDSGQGLSAATGAWGEEARGRPGLVLHEDGRLTGSDGCNRLMGSWEFDGEVVAFGRVASTMMFCQGVDTWLAGLHDAVIDGDEMRIRSRTGEDLGVLRRAEPQQR